MGRCHNSIPHTHPSWCAPNPTPVRPEPIEGPRRASLTIIPAATPSSSLPPTASSSLPLASSFLRPPLVIPAKAGIQRGRAKGGQPHPPPSSRNPEREPHLQGRFANRPPPTEHPFALSLSKGRPAPASSSSPPPPHRQSCPSRRHTCAPLSSYLRPPLVIPAKAGIQRGRAKGGNPTTNTVAEPRTPTQSVGAIRESPAPNRAPVRPEPVEGPPRAPSSSSPPSPHRHSCPPSPFLRPLLVIPAPPSRHSCAPLSSFLRRQESRGAVPGWGNPTTTTVAKPRTPTQSVGAIPESRAPTERPFALSLSKGRPAPPHHHPRHHRVVIPAPLSSFLRPPLVIPAKAGIQRGGAKGGNPTTNTVAEPGAPTQRVRALPESPAPPPARSP